MTPSEQEKKPRRARLRLPFDNRKSDPGTWAYNNRVGLCVTLIAYLTFGIIFIGGKIVVGGGMKADQSMLIDMQSLEEMIEEKERLEREILEKQSNQNWERIKNMVSNENAETADKGSIGASDPSSEQAQEVSKRMQANREAYEKGLADEKAIREQKNNDNTSQTGSDKKIKGSVTVSFSFVDPVRTSRHLVIPAYRCEGGGEVVVSVVVDNSGEVRSARVISGGDNCMRETALRAARDSQFNIDNSAPEKHSGTITYIFVPQ